MIFSLQWYLLFQWSFHWQLIETSWSHFHQTALSVLVELLTCTQLDSKNLISQTIFTVWYSLVPRLRGRRETSFSSHTAWVRGYVWYCLNQQCQFYFLQLLPWSTQCLLWCFPGANFCHPPLQCNHICYSDEHTC